MGTDFISSEAQAAESVRPDDKRADSKSATKSTLKTTATGSRVLTALGAGAQVTVIAAKLVLLSKDARAIWLEIRLK